MRLYNFFKDNIIRILVILFIIAALLAGAWYFLDTYRVSVVHVTGNSHYTDDEIRDMVLSDSLIGKNALYLRLKYDNKPVKDIPFIERMDVRFDSLDTITIEVYEKTVAGYVEFLGKYMYFDREGIVVESSDEKEPGIPQVMGLEFNYCVVGKPLPVGDDEVFSRILSLTQLFIKYELPADGIYFSGDGTVTLYMGDVRVMLGDMSFIDEKMMRLKNISEDLIDKTGTLHLENYSENGNDSFVTFEGK